VTRSVAAFVFAAAAALATGGCANVPAPTLVPAPTCARGQQPMRSELLYFGAAMPQGTVSAEDWRGFVDEVVTPRFPDGLTAWQASGQWKPSRGAPVREASWVVSVVHWPDAKSETAISAIVDAYKTRFHQESVLRVSSDACVTF
jgi:hypothetical protein